MADKDTNPTFGGFEALGDILLGPGEGTEGGIPMVDPEDIKADLDKDPVVPIKEVKDPVDPTKPPVEPVEPVEPVVPVVPPVEPEPVKPAEPTEEELKELLEYESDITSVFQEKIGESLDWDFGEDEKFETVDEFTKYMKEQVQAASRPTFASDEMEKLNKFVSEGGSLKDFYDKTGQAGLNLEGFEIEDNPSNQKAVVREYLSTRGYKDDRVQKVLDRYEEAGVLGEEAVDALELLKEYKEQNAKTLLVEQENQSRVMKEQQLKFISDVEGYIKSVDNIQGIKLSQKEKDKLKNDIFKPTADGRTEYQKKYSSNVKNLVESAYFTMNDTALINKLEEKAESSALRDLQNKLKAKGKRSKSSEDPVEGEGSGLLETLGRNLLG